MRNSKMITSLGLIAIFLLSINYCYAADETEASVELDVAGEYVEFAFLAVNDLERVGGDILGLVVDLKVAIQRARADNETFHVPVRWSLQGVSISENRTIIEALMFNDKLIQVNVGSLDENSFRFVIELWVYDVELNEFKFGWTSGDEQLCAWNQVWFNVLG